MYGNNAPWATLYEAFVLNQYLTKEMQFLPFLALFNILLISLRYFVIRLTTGFPNKNRRLVDMVMQWHKSAQNCILHRILDI